MSKTMKGLGETGIGVYHTTKGVFGDSLTIAKTLIGDVNENTSPLRKEIVDDFSTAGYNAKKIGMGITGRLKKMVHSTSQKMRDNAVKAARVELGKYIDGKKSIKSMADLMAVGTFCQILSDWDNSLMSDEERVFMDRIANAVNLMKNEIEQKENNLGMKLTQSQRKEIGNRIIKEMM